MIATVTCNPALDILVRPRRFSPGEINRYGAGMCQPGGKGINVSLLLHSLGVETKALALAGGFTGREIARLLEERGCPGDFVWLPQGDSRINLKICPPGGEETQLNGEGPQIPVEAVERLERKLSALGPGDGAVLAGSLPASLPQDLYARLMKPLVRKGVEVAVDTTGEALLAALPCRPFLVKPNLEELEELFSAKLTGLPEIKEQARELQRLGARNVVVSLGAGGALLLEEGGRSLFCHGVRGQAVSTVGAGDSLVAGFLYGWQLHGTLEGGLRWGMAAGAATAFSPGIATGEQVKALFPQVGNPQPL